MTAPKRLPSALLAELLPPGVDCALELLPPGDAPGPVDFDWDEERAEVQDAVPKRQREYASGRHLARELLVAAGAPDGPLLTGPDRAPLWPKGYTGSISHCDGLCAAAVARTADHASVGIDLEPATPLKPKLWGSILNRSEADRLEVMGERGAMLATAHFSGKEALYKLIAADFGRFVGFQEVELRFSLMKFTFTAHGGANDEERRKLATVQGRWRITGRHVLTTATWG